MTVTTIGKAYRQQLDLVYLFIETSAEADDGDTLAIDLQTYGIMEDGFLMYVENVHTTSNSILILPGTASTTAVSAGTLTITLGAAGGAGGTDDLRTFLIIGRSEE